MFQLIFRSVGSPTLCANWSRVPSETVVSANISWLGADFCPAGGSPEISVPVDPKQKRDQMTNAKLALGTGEMS